jgi:hypothetical protein
MPCPSAARAIAAVVHQQVGLLMNDESISDPTKTAVSFAEEMRRNGFMFDFTLASLETEVNRLLCSDRLNDHSNPRQWTIEAGLEAYVGEVLRVLFDGEWKGAYRADNPGPNFYCSWIEFGEYVYRPSHFLSYLISNGEGEGTFSQHLAKVLPFVKARESEFRPGAS